MIKIIISRLPIVHYKYYNNFLLIIDPKKTQNNKINTKILKHILQAVYNIKFATGLLHIANIASDQFKCQNLPNFL